MSQPPEHSESAITLQAAQGSDPTAIHDHGSPSALQENNGAPEVSQEDHLESLVDAFHDFLLDTVDISALQSVIQVLDEKQLVEIQDLESRGQLREATNKLIQYIKKSKQPGKWKAFFDGVRMVGNDIVVETVLEEKQLSKWNDSRIRLLRGLFANQIEEVLDFEPIYYSCMELIPTASQEKIEGLLNKNDIRTAIRVFLLNLSRRKSDWYERFLETLYDNDFKVLATKLDPDFVKTLEENRKCLTMSQGAEPNDQHVPHDEGGDGTCGANRRPPEDENPPLASSKTRKPRESTHACPCCKRIVEEVASMRKELIERLGNLEALIARNAVSTKGHASPDSDCV